MSKQPPPENPPVPVLADEALEDRLKEVGGYEHGGSSVVPIAKVERNEPIVTRKELWAYYCGRSIFLRRGGPLTIIRSVLQRR